VTQKKARKTVEQTDKHIIYTYFYTVESLESCSQIHRSLTGELKPA
jgi:hypothetical protein